MNVFLKELRDGRKSLFWWCIGMAFLVASGMAKYAAYNTSGQSINDLMSHMPRALQAMAGLGAFDLSTATGYFGVLYLYLILVATVHAVLLGVDIIVKEKRDQTSEFLFAKPISRSRVITAKLAAAFLSCVVLAAVTWVISLLMVTNYANGQPVSGEVAILMLGMFMLQLTFLALGTGIAGLVSNAKTASSVATGLLLLTFIISVVIDINDKLSFLRYLTPFKYFAAQDLLATRSPDPTYMVLAILIVIVGVTTTYLGYQKRDL